MRRVGGFFAFVGVGFDGRANHFANIGFLGLLPRVARAPQDQLRHGGPKRRLIEVASSAAYAEAVLVVSVAAAAKFLGISVRLCALLNARTRPRPH